MYLNKTNAAITSSWISTVNATDITLSAAGDVNASGETYVAYIFAHDDAQFGTGGDESIIKCGSYVGSTTNGLVTVDVGFEPQWVLIKRASDGSNHWMIFDNMRGAADNSSDQPYLSPNVSNAESSPVGGGLRAFITNNGFGWRDQGNSAQISYGGSTYIYMAIRRPNKPPEAGTDVFAIDTRGGTSPNPPTFNSGFPVDLVTRRDITTSDWTTRTRLLGENKLLQFNTLAAENTQTSSTVTFDRNDGVGSNTGVDGSNYAYMFKRAPGFMDVVTYEGTGANRTVNHNLTVKPELMLFKIRSHGFNWITYDKINGATKYMSLNGTDGGIVSSSMFNNTEPTSSVFTVAGASGNVNYSGGDLVAYLFATLPGISKVGSYTGTGNAINVDCGFTNGARFILLKLTSGAGNWYVYDSLRGIGSGDDPYFKLNSSAAQTTNSDYIDIDASGAGFKINSGSTFLNILNGNYIFLAIA